MKKFALLGTCMIACGLVNAQSIYPGQYENKMSIKAVSTPVTAFELDKVTLLPSRFKENQQRDSAWMASISVERLLHSFYTNSGVWGGREGGYMTVKKYGGWESLDCELRGHTTGHLMSGLALMYAATGSATMKAKGDSIIDGLDKVQRALGNGYLSAFPEELINRNMRGESVWAPWYTLHKILAGLIDQYLYAKNDKALAIATKMGDWAYGKLSNQDEQTRLKMIRNEFGGINEAFYNLYAITGNNNYKWLAEWFYHNDVIDPLKAHNGDFGTKHTNTFIPKTIAEVRRYELTNDKSALDASEFFWDEMIEHHTFAPGCSSDKEHYFNPTHFSEHISGYTGETCCTYNMLKLSRHLFCINPEARVMDYYERALYNHILGQQDPQSGMVAYFLPLKTGTHRVYSTPENSFWCCVGSGFENHAKYAESIYFKGSNEIFVNLFIPSVVNWEDTGLQLKQIGNFPAEPSTKILVSATKPTTTTINVRYPAWATSMVVKVNGKLFKFSNTPSSYVAITRKWKNGDKIEVTFGMELSVETASDNDSIGALLYGPIVLAGRLGVDGMVAPAPTSDPSKYNDYYTYNYNIPERLKEVSLAPESLKRIGELKWQTVDGIIVEPLYDVHRERYVIYWNLIK